MTILDICSPSFWFHFWVLDDVVVTAVTVRDPVSKIRFRGKLYKTIRPADRNLNSKDVS